MFPLNCFGSEEGTVAAKMIYDRAMEFRWDDEKRIGTLMFRGRTFIIEGYLDAFNCRKRAESMAEARGWKRPPNKIDKGLPKQSS